MMSDSSAGGNNAQQPSADFAQGMYVTLWPKVVKCHTYVSVLLAAQAQLQETIEQLIAALNEAKQADASSLVTYAHRLATFPARVTTLQRKLEAIDNRLLAMKHAPHPIAKQHVLAPEAYASPLF